MTEPSLVPLQMLILSHRIMVWVGKDPKDHPLPLEHKRGFFSIPTQNLDPLWKSKKLKSFDSFP